MILIYTFSVGTDMHGSKVQEDVEINVQLGASEKDIEEAVEKEYKEWLANNTDQSYWKKEILKEEVI